MRYYGIICMSDNGSTRETIIHVWAWDIEDARRRCRALGYLPTRYCLASVA